MRIS
ncbi:hypothetical protein D044_1942A, partial [Vibrio parahaemolyticus EKP-026]|jgi:hypothetical protein